MKNILIIPSWYPTDKDPVAGVFIKEQAEALKEIGMDVSVFYSHIISSVNPLKIVGSIRLYKDIINAIPTYVVRGSSAPKRSFLFLNRWAKKHFQAFEEYLKVEGKPDIIHAHSFIGGYLAMKLSQKFDIPYIITEHHIEFLKSRPNARYLKIAQRVYENAELVIGVSTSLTYKLSQISSTKSIYIPNVINTQIFKPTNKKVKSNHTKLLCVANLEPYKNIERLINSMYLLNDLYQEDKYHLTIVGDGVLKESLHKLARNLAIDNRISWISRMDRVSIAKSMQSSDIFVLSSNWETFGVVLIESIACGTPVVCTAVGGPKDIISDKNGFYIPNATTEELASKIHQMTQILNTFVPRIMSVDIRSKYGAAEVAVQLNKTYQSILDNMLYK